MMQKRPVSINANFFGLQANILVTSDIHLSDKPMDEYRFGLFPWIVEQNAKYGITDVFLLGDITEQKDHHSSALVNRIVDGLNSIISRAVNVVLLKGNHDYVDSNTPFFKFLNSVEGLTFINTVTLLLIGNKQMLFIPNCPDPLDHLEPANFIFMHQTFSGAITETGYKIPEGVDPNIMYGATIYSGDVHVPQTVGNIEYVGAPYHTRFGDKFDPRIVLLTANGPMNLKFPAPAKLVLQMAPGFEEASLRTAKPGDYVKVRYLLTREKICEWDAIQRLIYDMAHGLGLFIHGFDPVLTDVPKEMGTLAGLTDIHLTDEAILDSYCEREGLSSGIKDLGRSLL